MRDVVKRVFATCHTRGLFFWNQALRYEDALRILTRSQAVAGIAHRTASHHLWDHVTSSVTWPFDSPYAISYWWSFGSKPLSLTVSEIFNVKLM